MEFGEKINGEGELRHASCDLCRDLRLVREDVFIKSDSGTQVLEVNANIAISFVFLIVKCKGHVTLLTLRRIRLRRLIDQPYRINVLTSWWQISEWSKDEDTVGEL